MLRRHSLLTGFAAVVTATGVARLSVLLNLAVLAHVLGVADLGLYSAVWSTIGLFVALSVFGLPAATARMVATCRVGQRNDIGSLLVSVLFLAGATSLVAAAVVAGLIAPQAEAFVHAPGFAEWIYLVVGNIPFLTLALVASSGLQGMEDFRFYAASVVAPAVLLVPLSFAGAKLDGLRGALGATLLVNFLAVLLALGLLHRCLKRHGLRWSAPLRIPLLRESVALALPLFLASTVVLPAWWLASLYLARVHGFTQVGWLAAGLAVFQLLQFLPGALNIPTLPALTLRLAEKDTESFGHLAEYNFRVVWVASVPVLAVSWALARPLSVYLFGSDFGPAAEVLRWLALAGFLSAVSLSFASALISSGRGWPAFGLNSYWFVLFIGLLAVLAPGGGASGVGQAACLSYLLYAGALWWYCARRLGVSFAALPRLLLMSAVIVHFCWWVAPALAELSRRETLLAATVGGLVGLGVAAFWALLPQERQQLWGRVAHSLRGFSRA